jgi:Neuraminidase (sialidase)
MSVFDRKKIYIAYKSSTSKPEGEKTKYHELVNPPAGTNLTTLRSTKNGDKEAFFAFTNAVNSEVFINSVKATPDGQTINLEAK